MPRPALSRTVGTIAATAAVLLTAGFTPVHGSSSAGPRAAAAPAAVEQSGALFNNPLGTAEEQQRIRTKILQYVGTSPAGASIKVALYHFWDQEVGQALADAHARGVGVQLVLDESTVSARPSDPTYGILRTSLGGDTSQPSFVTLCPAGKSCLGRPEFGASINHNKFWLFSQVDGAADVTLQTSTNMSPSSYSAFWNDAFVVANNTGIYNAYASYFTDLVRHDAENWRYRSSTWSPYKAYFFPYYPGTGNTTDTIWNTLDNVTCTYTQDGAAKTTKVRVAMFKFTRQGVADKLVALKKAGCSVELVYTETDSKASSADGQTPGTWETLHSATGFTPLCYHHDHDNNAATSARVIHSKYLLIDGKYDGSVNKVLWTGSHNYSGPALRENDEALLKVDDSAQHDLYVAHFNSVKAAAVPGTSDDVPQCKGVLTQPEG
ncbi:phospholipase D-like domain-containing protein [Streptomyces sp. NPDC058463]|uniref:phospholipase D-like domain-containing protein n=1 Tax=Streptomyces sp. NPDC058463 TaxID=3346510 RepID=UPI00364DA5B4